MTIAIISDIHSNVDALKAVIKDIRSKGIKDIYCTGDLIGYYHDPNGVVDVIKAEEVITIQGNHDQKYIDKKPLNQTDLKNVSEKEKFAGSFHHNNQLLSDENRHFLEICPETLTVDLNGHQLLLVHGAPSGSKVYMYQGDPIISDVAKTLKEDGIVYGHTHIPYVETVEGKLFVNPGSVGKPKQASKKSTYVTIDEDLKVTHYEVTYNQDQVRLAIEKEPLIDIKLLDTL